MVVHHRKESRKKKGAPSRHRHGLVRKIFLWACTYYLSATTGHASASACSASFPNSKDTMAEEPSSQFMEIGASDVIRLIQGYLTSSSLHESNRVLREESGIGAAGVPHRLLPTWATQGKWGLVLRTLSTLDRERCRLDVHLIAQVHEMAILELAAAGDFEVAYAAFRFAQTDLEASQIRLPGSKEKINRGRHLAQKLAALAATRAKDPKASLPSDYYDGRTRDDIRKEIATKLDSIPEQPTNRLALLIQQAIKYQSFTGDLPKIKELWPSEEEGEDETSRPKKKKRRKVFDLVLGTSHYSAEPAIVGESSSSRSKPAESIPSKPFATIKFGKKAWCEAAAFLPDGSGLVTGSSDGLIEIWDASQNFNQLRHDLPYQKNDELLGHDVAVTALAVSNDGALLASGDLTGQVNIWRIDTGRCLCILKCHSAAVSNVQFSPNGSHILTAGQDSKCREFGLRTSKMLKEFTGHNSYVNTCFYSIHPSAGLRVITGSVDGKVRVFDASSAECLVILQQPGPETKVGVSLVMTDVSTVDTRAAIACVLPLHTPSQSMVLVARSGKAVLVNSSGVVLQVFEDTTSSKSVFCAASTSPSNRYLFLVREDGTLSVFDVGKGTVVGSIDDFGRQSMSKEANKTDATTMTTKAEITCLVSHPNRNMIAAFSNDKTLKKGLLVVWK